MMSRHFEAFDRLRKKGFFIGEFIWNFADFKTAQSKDLSTVIKIFVIRTMTSSSNKGYWGIFAMQLYLLDFSKSFSLHPPHPHQQHFV